MLEFSGRWSTTFGALALERRGVRVYGTYRYRGVAGRISGRCEGNVLRFRYVEPAESGRGEFCLSRDGRFTGSYRPKGALVSRTWSGHRGWDGLWDTDFGRLRLFQHRGEVRGCYSGASHAQLHGRVQGDELDFRYSEAQAAGTGRFKLSEDGESFTGRWRARGQRESRDWNGARTAAAGGTTWLVVLEAHWQKSLAEPEYAYGAMVRELFARQPAVRVRQRFFHDAGSLEHWCRELAYLAEPAILMIASHGLAEGLSVHGRLINTSKVLAALRDVEDLRLLHFSSCLVGMDGERSLGGSRFPISGYTTAVDWGASALLEFTYLDLMLNRGLAPREAAMQLRKLVPYAGNRVPRGSPYPAAGFRFFPAR